MQDYQQVLLVLVAFIVVAISANQIAQYFKRIKLPLITGLLFVGIACGPFLLKLISFESITNLRFINDIALAYIAFAASGELYLKEMRRQINSIKWMTFGQLVVTFTLSGICVFFLSGIIPFMIEMSITSRVAVSLLFATIFVANSPASAMAVISEVRAKGPFTRVTIGVTVLKDFLVIILFTICFNIADALITGQDFGLSFMLVLIAELLTSFGLGLLVGRMLYFVLSRHLHKYSKTLLVLTIGYGSYLLGHFVKEYTLTHFGFGFHIEPLLICIIGSFWVSNYTKFRHEFINILDEIGPLIYISFFTLAGASLSLDVLWEVGIFAIILFVVRLLTIVMGAYVGSSLAKDPLAIKKISWMPYVTQAGVGLGLATIVESAYPQWGNAFSTLVIAVIVINQVVGPPLFKWAIYNVQENHNKANTQEHDGIRDAIIFGLESQSIALARQLNEHGWLTKIVTKQKDVSIEEYEDLEIHFAEDITLELLETLEAKKSEGIVLMHKDEENLAIFEMIYENIGTENIVVRVNNHYNMKKFHDLGALVVNPSTAIVSLMDHFVRSPQATSLLLGMQQNQDTLDLEVLNPDLVGLALRDLRLPADIIILSIKRKGQMIISHGYTRLRKGDWVTLVGSNEGLDKMTLMFDR